MAAVAKSWMRTHCAPCAGVRVFLVREDWVLVCSACGAERRLGKNGLLLATA